MQLGGFRLAFPFALLLASCGPTLTSESLLPEDGGGTPDASAAGAPDAPHVSPGIDARVIPIPDAAPIPYGDADNGHGGGCAETECPSPVDDGCGPTEACDNGSDDDCDGLVDEDCPCTPGAVQPCFVGYPGRRNVGSCEDGTQRCEGNVEFNHWGDCTGGIWPSGEQCDTQDNNCNGCADDHPDCCVVELACPGPGDLPEASPFVDYVIDGTLFYPGEVATWSWTVQGGPCDQLLDATASAVSYTLDGASTSTVTFRPTLSGDYTFTMTATTADGTVYTCTFIVHVRGPGLRVELCWDTTGSTDIDLHLHRPGTTTPWFTTDGTTNNPDDCFYGNCKAFSFAFPLPIFPTPEWGYGSSSLAECEGGPEGAQWSTVGSCHNPRLDVDNISTAGTPENINVDNPREGDRFRVMVHYYSGSVPTHPLVNVYCGGTLLGTYGAAPDTVGGFASGGGYAAGTMWRVVDATTHVTAGVTTGCDLAPLHPPGTASGHWVTVDDLSY